MVLAGQTVPLTLDNSRLRPLFRQIVGALAEFLAAFEDVVSKNDFAFHWKEIFLLARCFAFEFLDESRL